jgi:hypothetical protein
MAALEELLVAALTSDATLAPLLATWDGLPAVFVEAAWDDQADGWGEGGQYPRIVLSVVRGWDPARSVDGTVRMYVAGEATQLVVVRDRATLVLQDRVYRPDGEVPQVTRARGSMLEPITLDSEKNLQEHQVEFDLVMLVPAVTFEPDPVQAMIDASTAQFGASMQTNPATWGPTDAVPALYWTVNSWEQAPKTVRLNKGRLLRRWNVELRAHVLSPDAQVRLRWSREVAEWLSRKLTFVMPDGSSLDTVHTARVMPGEDPVRAGQVQVGLNFRTVTAADPTIRPLRHIHTTDGSDMSDLNVRTAAP